MVHDLKNAEGEDSLQSFSSIVWVKTKKKCYKLNKHLFKIYFRFLT